MDIQPRFASEARPPCLKAIRERMIDFEKLGYRGSLLVALGSIITFCGSEVYSAPAYKAATIVEFFSKSVDSAGKEDDEGGSRGICFNTECNSVFDLLVAFEFGSDRLTTSAKENLDQFALALQDEHLKGHRFEVDGHTDARGGADYNQQLSERRAAAVVSYLISKGIDQKELEARGFGKTKPRVKDAYSAENRRVETHLLFSP